MTKTYTDDQKEAIKRLLKIKALKEGTSFKSEQSVSDEFIARLLKKYNLTLDDLTQVEEPHFIWLRYKDQYEEKLILQVIAKITGTSSPETWQRGRRKTKETGVAVTKFQGVQIKLLLGHYTKHLRDALDDAFYGFCIKHDILAPTADEKRDITGEDIKRFLRAEGIANNLTDVESPINRYLPAANEAVD